MVRHTAPQNPDASDPPGLRIGTVQLNKLFFTYITDLLSFRR
jgi:hypothetical protein